MSWLKKNFKNIALVVSLVLNALGGTGVIPPVVAEKAGNIAGELAK
jgi:hypothetical protein